MADLRELKMSDFPDPLRANLAMLRAFCANDEAAWLALCNVMRALTAQPATVPEASPAITKTVCDGCPHLKTEYWRDYLDNDETDSGTLAECMHSIPAKTINAYWNKMHAAPSWCPLTAAPQPEAKPRRCHHCTSPEDCPCCVFRGDGEAKAGADDGLHCQNGHGDVCDAWKIIEEMCVITEAVTPGASDVRGTINRLIDYHVRLSGAEGV